MRRDMDVVARFLNSLLRQSHFLQTLSQIPGPTGLNRHGNREIEPAYTSRDMIKIIDQYQPDLWVYGHTHQPNDQTFGKTRIISNPRGYAFRHELCEGFDPYGKPVEVK